MDFEKELDILKEKDKARRRESRVVKNNKEQEASEIEFSKIQERYFDVIKNLTILSGTVFASSIALATGKQVGNYFVVGELILFISTLIGAIYIWSSVKSREVSYFYDVKWRMETDLIVNKDIVENFDREQTEKLIKDYDRLINKRSILYYILRVIKIDWLPTIFFTTFTIGLFFIWFSLVGYTTPQNEMFYTGRRLQEFRFR